MGDRTSGEQTLGGSGLFVDLHEVAVGAEDAHGAGNTDLAVGVGAVGGESSTYAADKQGAQEHLGYWGGHLMFIIIVGFRDIDI